MLTPTDREALRALLADLSDYRLGAALLTGGGFVSCTGDSDDEALERVALLLGRAADHFKLGPGVPARWRGAALYASAQHHGTPETASDLGRMARLAVGTADTLEPMTFEPRFNNGRGGASITIGGRTRLVEGEQARALAEALEPRRRVDRMALAEAARRQGGGG